MLNIHKLTDHDTYRDNASLEKEDEWINFDVLQGIVQRQWKVVAAAMAVGLILGLAFLLSATPRYSSVAAILYEKQKTNVVNDLTTQSDVFGDQSEFSTQLELFKSRRILSNVVEELNLHLDEGLLNEGRSGLSVFLQSLRTLFNVSSWFASEDLSEVDVDVRKKIATNIVRSNIEVARLGVTYIMLLRYTSESPSRAQRIASQIAKAYLNDQLDAKYDAAKLASEWLQTRIDDLKTQSVAAELAVQDFKEKNDLVQAGTSSNIAEAQLAGANAQLISIKGEVAARKAESEKLQQAIDSGNVSIVVDAALGSDIIDGLRKKYLDLNKREAEFSARLGNEHDQVIKLRNEMREYQRLMFEELRRLRDSAVSKYEIALKRQNALENNLESSVGQTAEANRVQVQLRSLEREAATYKSLLENFLQKYQESIQQQTLPISEARVIEDAQWPSAPSYPKKKTSLAIAILLGGVFGAGIAGFREFMERYFRTGDQIRNSLHLDFLGMVPKVDHQPTWTRPEGADGELSVRAIRHINGVTNFVTQKPLSSFAETMRATKLAANILDAHQAKVIGVVSSLPGEGKSTVSSNLAQLLSLHGSRTLLIDGDMRNPGLTKMLAPQAQIGLVECLIGNAPLETILIHDPEAPNLSFIPTTPSSHISHTSDLLASIQMQSLLKKSKQQYDYIIVDLPPMAPVVDVKAFDEHADGFVYVVEWGKTSRSLVKSLLTSNPSIRDKCLGVILNKTNLQKMKYYPDRSSTGHYYSTYTNYYRDDSI